MLGQRLRQIRRRLTLHQKQITETTSPSLLSKVETGKAQPSLESLRRWAVVLETTLGDILGDQLVLEAAKQTILITDKCHEYLAQLERTSVTEFLHKLSTCATSLATPVPTAPPDPELAYLTARVFIKRGEIRKAAECLESALNRCNSPLWRIHILFLLCQVYDTLSDPKQKRRTKKELSDHLAALDPEQLTEGLPPAECLNSSDLELLRLSLFLSFKTPDY